MTKSAANPAAWQTAIVILAATVVGIVVLAGLYWAQAVCIPVALAAFLTIVLSPLVTTLQRWGLGRTMAVILPVVAVALLLGAVAWLVGAQARTMAGELPKYAANIRDKVRSLRTLGQGPLTRRLETMVREITDELDAPMPGAANETRPNVAKPPQPLVQPGSPSWLAFLPALLGRVAETLGGLVMTLVLLAFMLTKREDLRSRLIRLLGNGRLATTTKVLSDASQRISRYLLMQLIVNGIFGLTLSLGLLAIGIPYAFLWGFSGFVLRYIPYIGVWVAALPPIFLTLAMFEGWSRPLMVLGLFLAIEMVTSNAIEPRLYGRSIGVSEIAFLVAAAFGAILWGPIGIILSSPAIVCLVVLGKYVPFLKFLDILLGDEPALTADLAFYQRLLAHKPDEAREIVAAGAKQTSLQRTCDEILVPALKYFKHDRHRDELTETDAQFMLDATAELLETLDAADDSTGEAKGGTAHPEVSDKILILACPAHDEADRLALAMLRRLLDPAKWEVDICAAGTLASELVARVAARRPAVVCIGAVPPGGLPRTRYLSTRLKARFPGTRLIVGRWGLARGAEENRRQLRHVGVHFMGTTLAETRSQLRSLLPALVWQQARGRAAHTDGGDELVAPGGSALDAVGK